MSEYHVERQFDNYPKSVTDEQKRELEEQVRLLLIKYPTLSMRQIYHMIGDKVECLKGAAVWDYIWACIERALNAVAEPVWKLDDKYRYQIWHHNREQKMGIIPLHYDSIRDMNEDREPGERKEWFYQNAFCSAFPELFGDCDSNYEVRDRLLKAGVLTKRNKFEAETCCLYLYFSSEKAARAFVDRFNRWAFEYKPILQTRFIKALEENKNFPAHLRW